VGYDAYYQLESPRSNIRANARHLKRAQSDNIPSYARSRVNQGAVKNKGEVACDVGKNLPGLSTTGPAYPPHKPAHVATNAMGKAAGAVSAAKEGNGDDSYMPWPFD
jgi:hypothetical protein